MPRTTPTRRALLLTWDRLGLLPPACLGSGVPPESHRSELSPLAAIATMRVRTAPGCTVDRPITSLIASHPGRETIMKRIRSCFAIGVNPWSPPVPAEVQR